MGSIQRRRMSGSKRPTKNIIANLGRTFGHYWTVGAALYVREVNLPALIGVDPACLGNPAKRLDGALKSRLIRALRSERRRGRSGHWTYDLNRHIALYQAVMAETSAFKKVPQKAR